MNIEIRLTDLSTSGEAIGHLPDGQVIFVGGGVPGDKVLISIIEKKTSYSRANIISILEKSSDRVPPPCKLAEAYCGGCPLMILNRKAQLRFKENFVQKALRKINAPIYPIFSPNSDFHYRIRAKFVKRDGILGFQAPRSHQTHQVLTCMVLHPHLDQVLCQASQEVESYLGEEGTISGLIGKTQQIHFDIQSGQNGNCNQIHNLIQDWMRRGLIVGAKLDGVLIGKNDVNLGNKKFPLWSSSSNFAQASEPGHTILPEFIAHVMKQSNRLKKYSSLLELFAGSGNFTRYLISLAHQIDAVESDLDAATSLKNLLLKNVSVYSTTAEKALLQFQAEGRKWDVALLDPPRQGAKEIMILLAKVIKKSILYVSCDAMTLARDLIMLEKEHFRVEWIQPFDLMPHTTQIELVAKLKRDI